MTSSAFEHYRRVPQVAIFVECNVSYFVCLGHRFLESGLIEAIKLFVLAPFLVVGTAIASAPQGQTEPTGNHPRVELADEQALKRFEQWVGDGQWEPAANAILQLSLAEDAGWLPLDSDSSDPA